MTVRSYLERLGRAHGFTLDELRANQNGTLHPAQLARGRRRGLFGVIVLAALGLLALAAGSAGAYAFHDSLGPAPSDTDINAAYAIAASGLLLASILLLCAGVGLTRQRARHAAFVRGAIETVEAPVEKIHVRGRGIPDRYIFRFDRRSYDTSKELWNLLTQGATYRFHCVADQLLSFAPVFEDAVDRAEYEHEVEQFELTRRIEPSGRID